MNAVRQSCRPKHQVLILKCYPRFQKGVQSVKPNSSELSYLLYYASTRRSKLQKVGAFLEKRAARDVWRGKIGNVQVTLQILAALIEKVPRDLPLYARSVLTILDTILRSRDISIVEESIPAFEIFCRHQDLATLSADQDYVVLYRNIVRAYANFASADSTAVPKTPLSRPMVLRWKKIGLQAIKSVVSSESLATDGPHLLRDVMPVILRNLYASGDPLLSPLQKQAQSSEQQEREQARRRRMSIATVQTVDTVDNPTSASGTTADADKAAEVEARVLALRCLERVFTAGSNRGQIQTSTKLVLEFIVSQHPPRQRNHDRSAGSNTDENWATNLLEVVVDWTPVQDRFIILVALVDTLVNSPFDSKQPDSKLTLASLMDWLLCSPVNLIGLSVLDVLIELVQFLLALLRHEYPTSTDAASRHGDSERPASQEDESADPAASHPDAYESTDPTASRHQELIELLQKCIGDLATHIYYADQVSDMIRSVISRLRPSTSPEESSDEASPKSGNAKQDHSSHSSFSFPAARSAALKTVKDILVVANLRKSMAGTTPDSRNRVPIQVWEGTHWLLRDSDRAVRYAYVDAFLSWLQLETDKSDLKVTSEAPRVSKLGAAASPDPITRRVSSLAAKRDRAATGATSTFLQLLHLVAYEVASDAAVTESDILVLHLLLANLVENMGINAARHGLPVIMRLQDDYLSDERDCEPAQVLLMGSLVHGYLWALVEKFDLEGTRVGNEIINETCKRKQRGIWLDKMQLPPRPLDYLVPSLDSAANEKRSPLSTKAAYTPFTAVKELVSQIENAYVASFASPAASPPNSPGRVFSISPLTQHYAPLAPSKQPSAPALPSNIKDEMVSPWSKESCLAALENENTKSSSGSGTGTKVSGVRNHMAMANGFKSGNASPIPADSPTGNHRNRNLDRPNSAAYSLGAIQKARRPSAAEETNAPATASSRESTVRVNELRRVLSVINSTNARRPSPLRDHPKVGSDGSSTESMVTDTFTASDIDVSGPAAVTDGCQTVREDSETPKASAHHLSNGGGEHDGHHEKTEVVGHRCSDDIPPVPPLPSSLAIPGSFPADSITAPGSPFASPSHSPVRSQRPRTAPSASAAANGQTGSSSTLRPSRSFTRQKPPTDDAQEPLSLPRKSGLQKLSTGAADRASTHASQRRVTSDGSRTLSLGRRVDVERLLEGLGPTGGSRQVPVQPAKTRAAIPRSSSSSSYSPAGSSPQSRRIKNPYNLTIDVEDWSSRQSRPEVPSTSRVGSATTRGGIGPPPY